jgi:DNA-binding XRE family transcriptional regulator
LSVTKQAEVVGIARSTVYYLPRPVPAADLALMHQIDKLHTELPFAGARMLRRILAATDEELAEAFGVNQATIYRWQKAHPEFCEAIRAGKLVADIKVAEKLHEKAKGFDYIEEQPIKLKKFAYDENGKKVRVSEWVEILKLRRRLPPDTTAAMFWLTNRQNDKWKLRVANEHAGERGGAIERARDSCPDRLMTTDKRESGRYNMDT